MIDVEKGKGRPRDAGGLSLLCCYYVTIQQVSAFTALTERK